MLLESVSEPQKARIEAACASVVNRYGQAVNRWDLAAFVDLFTERAVWQRPGVPALTGHSEILDFMAKQPGPSDRILRHIQGGIVVNVRDGSSADVYSQTVVYDEPYSELPASLAAPDMVVEYQDEMVLIDGQWLIARRDTVVTFRRAAPSKEG